MTKGLALPFELVIRIHGRKRTVLISVEGKKKVRSLSSSGERPIYPVSPAHLLHLGSGSLESVFIYCLLEAKSDTKF